MSETERYNALALQITCRAVNKAADPRATIMENIAEVARLVTGSSRFVHMFSGGAPRLVVLPEYFLTSYPAGDTIPGWQEKACLHPDGPEYEALGRIAQDNRLFLSGNAYEVDPAFPALYFQVSFIINDSGEVVLRYRRLVSMFAPTPHDVLDAFLDRYGAEALFPVADTALGRLACVASEEILYPEISRALAVRGAEVICHSSSEAGCNQATPKNIAKRARAIENLVYVVSANSAGIEGIDLPVNSTDGHSQVVDYRGNVLAEAGFGESLNGQGLIDLAALRSARRKPAMGNLLARQRLDLFASTYANIPVHTANGLLDEEGGVIVPDRSWFSEKQAAVIEDLARRGVI